MNKSPSSLSVVVGVFAAVALNATSMAQSFVGYENSDNTKQLGQISLAKEFGDQITFNVPGGVEVTQFSFEYYGTLTPADTKTAVLKLYALDGAPSANSFGRPTPGTVLFNSTSIGTIQLDSGFNTVTIDGINTVGTPSNTIAWTISFNGLSAGEEAGLLIYGGPSIGSSFNDFWTNDGGTWSLNQLDNGNIPVNFAAKATIIPEPSTVALALVGAAALLGLRRRQ